MHLSRRSLARGLAALSFSELYPASAASDPFLLKATRGRLDVGGRTVEIMRFGDADAAAIVRMRQGDEIRLQLLNRLPMPLSIHSLGLRIANAMDGVAGLTQPPVPPDGSFDYRFVPPDSGTFLLRPCVPSSPTPSASLDGLHALLVVEEREPPPVDREFFLVATQWRIGPAASLVAVNNRIAADTATLPQGARVRLRVANAAQAALLLLAVEGARLSVIAIDSQACEPFVPPRGVIPIGPGARFDLVLDLPRKAGAAVRVSLRDALDAAAPPATALVLATTDAEAPARATPLALSANPRLPVAIALERAARADIVLAAAVPGRDPGTHRAGPPRRSGAPLTAMLDAAEPILSVARGRPIVFSLVNPSPRPMSVHVHGHALRVLHDLDDGWHPYWRDTVLIEPGKTHHAAFVADNPGKWLVQSVALGSGDPSSARFGWYEVH